MRQLRRLRWLQGPLARRRVSRLLLLLRCRQLSVCQPLCLL